MVRVLLWNDVVMLSGTMLCGVRALLWGGGCFVVGWWVLCCGCSGIAVGCVEVRVKVLAALL